MKRPFIIIALSVALTLAAMPLLPKNIILAAVFAAPVIAFALSFILFIRNKKHYKKGAGIDDNDQKSMQEADKNKKANRIFICSILSLLSISAALISYTASGYMSAPVKNLRDDNYVCEYYITSNGYKYDESTKFTARVTKISDVENNIIDIKPFDIDLYFYNDSAKKNTEQLQQKNIKYKSLLKVSSKKNELTLRSLSNKNNKIYKNASIKRSISQENFNPGFIYSLRCYIENAINDNYKSDDAGIISGIMIGDKSGIDSEARADFMRSGMSHILATSGMHMSFLIAVIGLLAALFIKNRKLRLILTLIIVTVFTALAGFTPSVMRAAFMSAAVLTASAFYYRQDSYNTLALAASVLLIISPYIIYNISFLLSVSAVLGVIYAGGVFKKIKTKYHIKNRAFIFLLNSLIISIFVMLLCAPLMLIYFGGISIVSSLSNIICVPLGFIIFFLGMLSVIFAPAAPVINIIAAVTTSVISLFRSIIEFISGLSFSYITVGYSFVFITIIFVFIMLIISSIRKKDKPRKFTVAICAVCVLTSGILGHTLAVNPEIVKVSFLDVGQGDCSVITNGRSCVMVDCGGTTEEKAVKQYFQSNIISKIDYLVLTHSHEDHISGVSLLLNNYKVNNIIIPNSDDGFEELIELAEKRNARVIRARSDCSFSIDNMKFMIFTKQSSFESGNINDSSIVVKLGYKNFEAMFTGDLTDKGEQTMLRNYTGSELDIDLLKAGHHGSKTSSSSEFLNVISPNLTVISVAENNRYSLPSGEALGRIEKAESKILRTDINSCVSVISNGTKARVSCEEGS